MFFGLGYRALFTWLIRRRVAVAMLLLACLVAAQAVQLYNRRAAALERSKLGPRYRQLYFKTSTRPTTMQVQIHRRALVQTPSEQESLAAVHKRTATGPPCIDDTFASPTIEERDQQRTACRRRGRRLRCNYAAENGVDFVVHENFIASDDCPPAYAENVTLVTHATYGFLRHVAGLCDRWQGPLSVAVFAPGADFDEALAWIDFLRRCGRNPCVRRSVTWHLVYDREHTPTPLKPGSLEPSNITDARGYLSCSSVPPLLKDAYSFRRSRKIPYPVNVLRNVARKLAPTHYVLVLNARFYPSLGIVPRFLGLVAEQRRMRSFRSDGLEVYVLPPFAMTPRADGPEVEQQAPGNMRQLRESLRSGAVVPLNDSSHGGELWSRSFYSAIMNGSSEPRNTGGPAGVKEERLIVHATVKRDRDVFAWEPVFVGTRDDDPPYSETMTWEGGHERVPQGYLMCLEDYDFHILEGAFVVRVPGLASGGGAVVRRIGSPDPTLQNQFSSLRRVIESTGLRYPIQMRDRC